jgi:23S rRNA (uridine2552-2'-O)-methyltransferase
MAKKKSSPEWLREHFTDPYVKQAQKEGYRSRAVYKLLEMQERYRLFKKGMIVIDLGAAPGGWSQLVVKMIKPAGRMIALDILPMDSIEGVEFIQGDFSDEVVMQELQTQLAGAKADWVISDMAPNMSGNDSVDIPRSMYLCELALDFALQSLNSGGGFFIKVFQGEGFDAFLADIKKSFKTVVIRKPKASRDRSREVYVLAQDLRRKTNDS